MKKSAELVNADIKLFAYVLIAVNLVLRLLIALRPLRFTDGLTIPDDAYLSLKIAKNIASGLGPIFGSDYTNGFQPLYVFLMTPIYFVFPHDLITPVHIALVLLAIFDTLALYFLIKLVSRHSKNGITAIFASVLWIANPYIMATTANGLETMISVFLIIYTLYYSSKKGLFINSLVKPKEMLILGILLGLSVFTRIDNLIFVLSFMAVTAYMYLIGTKKYSFFFTSILIILLGFITAYAPWLLYSLSYTGDIYPVSGKAIRMISLSEVNYQPNFFNLYYPMIIRAWQVLLHFNKILILLSALLVFIVIYKYGFKTFRQSIFSNKLYLISLISIVILVLSYIFYNYAFWFFPRYFFPVVLPLIFYSCLLFDLLMTSIKKPFQRYTLAAFLIIIAISGNLMIPELKPLFFSKNDRDMGYMNLGLWAERYFPDSAIIGSPQTGALSYFAASKKIVNLDGVVNKSCFEAIRRKKLMDYVNDKQIQYVIGWAENIYFIKNNSVNFNSSSLVLIKKIDDFKSWNYEWFVYKTNLKNEQIDK